MKSILVDRHHADLLYALQLLFEDRLGVDVYVPVGREWWDEDVWRFGQVFGDDRLARQYLDIHEGIWIPHYSWRGYYTTLDVAHPARVIKGITLDAARQLQWDFVMPSVQENQAGYHRFAQERGARYLYNVGNTGQYIDWDLDPFVLSNSEMPLLGQGMVLHQEIESGPGGDYAFCGGAGRAMRSLTVRNFVNAFDRLPGWVDFLEAEAQLHEFHFTTHGHDGRDGNINPSAAVAELMGASGWGWHDKPVGDGFGHVIHSWAAVGRPLIGHGHYYAGKMPEPFWVHGETCIDLDVVTFHDALGMLREIASSPERHREMCFAIREVFDRHVNYAAEAAQLAAHLGL